MKSILLAIEDSDSSLKTDCVKVRLSASPELEVKILVFTADVARLGRGLSARRDIVRSHKAVIHLVYQEVEQPGIGLTLRFSSESISSGEG